MTHAIIPSDAGQHGAIMPSGAGQRVEWTLERIITTWLDAKMGRSQSARTRETYATTLASYRATLHQGGLDLDSPDVTTLATLLQGWAKKRWAVTGKPIDTKVVSANLHNQRIAIVSSFYAFARKRGYAAISENPADMVDRAKVQAYAKAKAIPAKTVKDKLGAIDRTTLKGARDYALLAVMLYTGRRLSEIAAMRRRDLSVSDDTDAKVTADFPHAKGGKALVNVLNVPTSATLRAWLEAFYGVGALASEALMAADAPIWVTLARNFRHNSDGAYGGPLSIQAIADVCEQRLGVKKPHKLRHSFAHQMEQRGAKVSEIQHALGHSSLATTGIYLASLDDNARDNPQGDGLADDFGIVAPGGSPSRPRRASPTHPLGRH